jgi:hypothetical protein
MQLSTYVLLHNSRFTRKRPAPGATSSSWLPDSLRTKAAIPVELMAAQTVVGGCL